jgi:hypothetical protein
MNCSHCSTSNTFDSRYCKQCGLPLFQSPVSNFSSSATQQPVQDRTIVFLVIMLALLCFETLFYKFIDLVLRPIVTGGRGYGDGLTTIYTICSWGFNLTTITLAVVFAVKSKNKLAKIMLFIYAAVFLINLIQYNIAALFREDFVYYNF